MVYTWLVSVAAVPMALIEVTYPCLANDVRQWYADEYDFEINDISVVRAPDKIVLVQRPFSNSLEKSTKQSPA